MALLLEATCECGISEQLTSAPTMMRYLGFTPGVCRACALPVSLDNAHRPRECWKCKSLDVATFESVPSQGHGDAERYQCPRCGQMHLALRVVGLAD